MFSEREERFTQRESDRTTGSLGRDTIQAHLIEREVNAVKHTFRGVGESVIEIEDNSLESFAGRSHSFGY
jgi:hypothetical protein